MRTDDNPVRILQVTTFMSRGGLETMIMNYYRHMDRNRIQFDFLLHREEKTDYEDEILSMGGRIYRVPRISPRNFSEYTRAVDAFFADHSYPVVHSHLDAMSAPVLKAAKDHGVPVRIAHSHNTAFDRDLKYPMRLFAKRMIPRYATHLWGCSEDAIAFMFGRDSLKLPTTRVLPNAIDPSVFAFSQENRQRIRREFDIGDEYVVGNVSRFRPQKNHSFLLKAFHGLLTRVPDARLLLVGDGPDEEKIRSEAADLGDRVIFAGVRDDVPAVLSAMDVFCFPSLFEGFGIALLEAQANGLTCITAEEKIPDSVDMYGKLQRLSLDDPAVWGEALSHKPEHMTPPPHSLDSYDIRIQAPKLEQRYLELAGG